MWYIVLLATEDGDVPKAFTDLNHKDWRSFCYESEWMPKNFYASNFVDGDLIELFLDMRRETKEDISTNLNIPLEQLCKTVEELIN